MPQLPNPAYFSSSASLLLRIPCHQAEVRQCFKKQHVSKSEPFMDPFRTRDADTVFANDWAGCTHTHTHTPAVFLKPCRHAFKNIGAVNKHCVKHIQFLYRTFKTHHTDILFANAAGCAPAPPPPPAPAPCCF